MGDQLKIDAEDLEQIRREAIKLINVERGGFTDEGSRALSAGRAIRDVCDRVASQNGKHFT